MPTTRRQFIKLGTGMVTVGLVAPRLLFEARAQSIDDPNRRIIVVIQTAGGNDGLNTLIPFTDSRYQSLRPTLHFKDSELQDSQGRSTIISNDFGLHPALGEVKQLYDAGKVAVIRGVGYPNPNLSHFTSMDIWHTAELSGLAGKGWLGRYADIALAGKTGLPGASIGTLPKSLFADSVVVPNITSFESYTLQTDPRYPGDRNNQLDTFMSLHSRAFDAGSYLSDITGTGLDALNSALQVQAAVGGYTSPVTYPENPNRLAGAMKMAAQMITTIPGAGLLYVQMGGFDNHAAQIATQDGQPNKLAGDHATLLRWFDESVRAFYDDMEAHGLADRVLMLQWSEFGRRPNENASFGTDHGTSSVLFAIGNPVKGGQMYGEQPSLAATELDNTGNTVFDVDFRSVYATVLDKWLGVDHREVLGSQFEDVGFLG